jgi:hypothetical protein
LAGELGREPGRLAVSRAGGGRLEERRDVLVRLVGREREVPRLHVGVCRARRQPRVERAPRERGHAGVDARRQQRVREPHRQVLLDDEQRVLLREREQSLDVLALERLAQRPHGGRAERGDGVEERRELGRRGLEPPLDRLAQRLGQRLARQRPRQLERVERVAARHLVDAHEPRPRDRLDRAVEHVAQLVDAERAEVDRLEPPRRDGAGELERVAAACPGRRQHADRLRVEAPEREAERPRRAGVEPLEVVDRDDDRAARDELAQRVEGRAPARDRVVLGAERGCVEAGRLEQVGERDEVERHLLLRGPREDDLDARRTAARDRVVPELGLADPRLAADGQRTDAVRQRGRERLDPGPLGLPPDHVAIIGRPPPPGHARPRASCGGSARSRAGPRASRAGTAGAPRRRSRAPASR